MRALAVLAVVSVLVVAFPVEAGPLPQTTRAAREFVHDTLRQTDEDVAGLVRLAHQVLRDGRGVADALAPAVPPRGGDIEVRVSMLQPPVAGTDSIVAALWIAASEKTWTGAYWAESPIGATYPAILEVDAEGVIAILDGGATAAPGPFEVTYHFLGADGRYTRHHVGRSVVLPETPVLGRAEVGGAEASRRGVEPEALFISPWNLFAENATIGMTIKAGRRSLEDVTVVSCVDYETPVMEPGCRQLYVLQLPPTATHVEVWHIDGDRRVVDRTLDRATLERGHTYG